MKTLTKLYPLLKDIGLDDHKSQEFIEIIEESYHAKIEQEISDLVTNKVFLTEITKLREEMARLREDMANMKVDLIKWNVGTILAVAGIVTAIIKLLS